MKPFVPGTADFKKLSCMENLQGVRRVTAHAPHRLMQYILVFLFYRRSKRPEKSSRVHICYVAGFHPAWCPCVLRLLCRSPVPQTASSSQNGRVRDAEGRTQAWAWAPAEFGGAPLGDWHLPCLKLSSGNKLWELVSKRNPNIQGIL